MELKHFAKNPLHKCLISIEQLMDHQVYFTDDIKRKCAIIQYFITMTW